MLIGLKTSKNWFLEINGLEWPECWINGTWRSGFGAQAITLINELDKLNYAPHVKLGFIWWLEVEEDAVYI